MATLPTNRALASTPEEHLADHAELATRHNATEGAWTTYTPTWITAGAGADPVLGNGSITGAYKLNSKTLTFRIQLTMGSTTTYGVGDYEFGLPAGMVIPGAANQAGVTVVGEDAGTGYISGLGRIYGGGGGVTIHTLGAITRWAATIPITWASGDLIIINGCVEVS